MLSAFIFDIGNVLLRFDFHLAIQRLARDPDPAAGAVLDLLEPVKAAYEGGRITRAEFQVEACSILGYTGSDEEFASAWGDIFTENEPMIRLVEKLHPQRPLYLLSNTSDLHLDFIFQRHPVFRLFRDGVYSFRARLSKPDPAIYALAIRQFGVDPQTTLFIDDLLPNVEAARLAGLRAHHYHHDRHLELVEELQRLGLQTD